MSNDNPDPATDLLAQLLQADLSKDPELAAKQRRLLEKLQESASDQPPRDEENPR